jgi:hypothetical protein
MKFPALTFVFKFAQGILFRSAEEPHLTDAAPDPDPALMQEKLMLLLAAPAPHHSFLRACLITFRSSVRVST